jgi:competence protein ComEA
VKAWITRYKFYLMACALIVLGIVYYFYIYQPETTKEQGITGIEESSPPMVQNKSEQDKSQNDPANQEKKDVDVIVDVKGAIKQPGVYHSNQNERVIDVIGRAGGLTDNADQTQVNFAAHVQDEMVIYIPAKGEVSAGPPVNGSDSIGTTNGGAGAQGGKININKADENELQNLPGIGPSKAASIIQYRQENGLFQSIEDLKKISGIGDKTFEKLKDSISIQ